MACMHAYMAVVVVEEAAGCRQTTNKLPVTSGAVNSITGTYRWCRPDTSLYSTQTLPPRLSISLQMALASTPNKLPAMCSLNTAQNCA